MTMWWVLSLREAGRVVEGGVEGKLEWTGWARVGCLVVTRD